MNNNEVLTRAGESVRVSVAGEEIYVDISEFNDSGKFDGWDLYLSPSEAVYLAGLLIGSASLVRP